VTTDPRTRAAFGFLILVQAVHSLEEYAFRLFDVFPPTRVVSSFFSSDTAFGFAIGNAGIVLFGAWCYLARVRRSHPHWRGYAWFWAALELANGVGHFILAAGRGGYFPGVATAPLLIAASSWLAMRLLKTSSRV
jgi:hypothetical protein